MAAFDFFQAVAAGVTRLFRGKSLAVNSAGFWKQFGFPDVTTRREVMAQARAEYQASRDFSNVYESAGFAGEAAPLQDLVDVWGLEIEAGTAGAAGEENATIYAPVRLRDSTGAEIIRAFSIDVPWDVTGDELDELIQDELDAMGYKYGLKVIGIFPGGFRVY